MRIRSVLVITVVAGAVAVAPAHGAIVANRSIAGVALGMSHAKVRALLGSPLRIIHRRNEITVSDTEFRYGRLSVVFAGDGHASFVQTTRTRERTRRGIGVGSSEADVRGLVGNVTCATEFGRRSCHTRDFLPGVALTQFDIRNGLVWRVSVGIVID